MDRALTIVGMFVLVCILIFGACLLTAFLVKWLFNSLAVDFALPYALTYWQAFKLSLLCSILFKSYNSNNNK